MVPGDIINALGFIGILLYALWIIRRQEKMDKRSPPIPPYMFGHGVDSRPFKPQITDHIRVGRKTLGQFRAEPPRTPTPGDPHFATGLSLKERAMMDREAQVDNRTQLSAVQDISNKETYPLDHLVDIPGVGSVPSWRHLRRAGEAARSQEKADDER